MNRGGWYRVESRRQLPWMKVVHIGDILQSGTGLLRTVREVNRYPNGDLRSVSLSIQKCSWTKRPTTSIGFTDLRLLGYEKIPGRIKLTSRLDREIAKELADHNRRKLHCCDVVGVIA